MTAIPDKPALRAQLRSLRRRLADETPDAAERAAALWPGHGRAGVRLFALYHPAGSELDPTPLRTRLPADGVALPAAQARDGALVFRRYRPGQTLVPDALGIPAPSAEAEAVLPDVVFAPLLAFDRRGGRLGQGGGHYDRTLEALRRVKPVFVIGLAYSGQELPEIPMEPHDQRLDAILTETGYLEFAKDRG
ncbi:5-formyltetrahydrofolate cyclo-ligase [Phenylobacterium sp. RIFCSPHIGHO2_01_FULL_69_31]|uniref:5-formyltetrahydrofolate cyclo-ligase n=1 Tax=Phenylobacterium sp. RIFCSPHIGHO2_01_FULL_69_31 TaxID=1801944 RepID=UPI000A7160B9|nr:5-formyltetrahydrofolate cyclo-ligase [Phenylobacterium sp. RIFCSPHIGHO2_01_FULL_69_31]